MRALYRLTTGPKLSHLKSSNPAPSHAQTVCLALASQTKEDPGFPGALLGAFLLRGGREIHLKHIDQEFCFGLLSVSWAAGERWSLAGVLL